MSLTWTTTSRNATKLPLLLGCLAAVLASGGCGPSSEDPAEQPETHKARPVAVKIVTPESKPAPYVPKPVRISEAGEVDFDINWPPGPLTPQKPSKRSLLTGQLKIRGDRKYWNTMTAFKQYKHWMPYVRGRDADNTEWLWPNLSVGSKNRQRPQYKYRCNWRRCDPNAPVNRTRRGGGWVFSCL